MITYRQDDDVLHVLDGSQHIGFVDNENALFLFTRAGHAEKVANVETRSSIPEAVRNYRMGNSEKQMVHQKYKNGEIKLYPYQECLAQFAASGGDISHLPPGVGITIIHARRDEIKKSINPPPT